jgi:hypothetical protein
MLTKFLLIFLLTRKKQLLKCYTAGNTTAYGSIL